MELAGSFAGFFFSAGQQCLTQHQEKEPKLFKVEFNKQKRRLESRVILKSLLVNVAMQPLAELVFGD